MRFSTKRHEGILTWVIMGLDVTLLELHPETEYRGVVYEHRAVVKPEHSPEFGVFDPDLVFEDWMVGSSVTVSVALLLAPDGVRCVEEVRPRIEPNPGAPTGWKNHTFYGRVDEVGRKDEYRYAVELDVGRGKIYLDPKFEAVGVIREGDALIAEASRTDVKSVE